MGCDENDSAKAEALDFESARRNRERRAESEEVHRQLNRLLAGDREAAGWLYDTFAAALLRRLHQRYHHLEGVEASDLLHDSFVFYFQKNARVLRNFLERVGREEQTMTRLERHLWDLACGVASNRRRTAAARDQRSVELPEDVGEPEDDTQEQLLLGRDMLERLDRCLKAGERRVYLYYKLRYWDGYAPNEIAAMTGWSQKTTYKLRQALTEAVRFCTEKLGIS